MKPLPRIGEYRVGMLSSPKVWKRRTALLNTYSTMGLGPSFAIYREALEVYLLALHWSTWRHGIKVVLTAWKRHYNFGREALDLEL
ncbi:unnamed protein product [Calypogeia fissa]